MSNFNFNQNKMFPIIFTFHVWLNSITFCPLVELYTSLSITIKFNLLRLVLRVGPLIARTTWSTCAPAMPTYGKTWTWIQTGGWWSSLSRSYRGERRVFDDNIGHLRVALDHPNNRYWDLIPYSIVLSLHMYIQCNYL